MYRFQHALKFFVPMHSLSWVESLYPPKDKRLFALCDLFLSLSIELHRLADIYVAKNSYCVIRSIIYSSISARRLNLRPRTQCAAIIVGKMIFTKEKFQCSINREFSKQHRLSRKSFLEACAHSFLLMRKIYFFNASLASLKICPPFGTNSRAPSCALSWRASSRPP